MERFGFPSIFRESILLGCLFSAQFNGAVSHASAKGQVVHVWVDVLRAGGVLKACFYVESTL